MLNVFKRKTTVKGVKWTCYPGRIGYAEDIQKEVNALNKHYKAMNKAYKKWNHLEQTQKATMQYLQNGLGQLIFWRAYW